MANVSSYRKGKLICAANQFTDFYEMGTFFIHG